MAVKMPKKVTLSVGETAEVKAVVRPTTATHQRATWQSSDTSIVRLSGFGLANRFVEGTIYGVSPGEAEITATIKEFDVYGSTKNMKTFTDTCIVRVVEPLPEKILIDAGHAFQGNTINHTYNGEGFTYAEGECMWVLQNMLVEELKNLGFINAECLRATNEYVTTQNQNESWRDWQGRENETRGKKATGYDLLIQLHSNSPANVNNTTPDYVVVFYPIDGRNGTQALGEALADAIKTTMEIDSNSIITTDSTPGNPLVEAYAVMRGAQSVNCPRYFLTENSFHTNPRAAHWLTQDDNLQELAKAYAEVIKDHFTS